MFYYIKILDIFKIILYSLSPKSKQDRDRDTMTDTDIETLKEKKELYRKFGVKRKCAVNERNNK